MTRTAKGPRHDTAPAGPPAALGGMAVLQAAARRFFTYCREHSISLDGARGFTMSYDNTVPRQSGLAGSSAIITAGGAHTHLAPSPLPASCF